MTRSKRGSRPPRADAPTGGRRRSRRDGDDRPPARTRDEGRGNSSSFETMDDGHARRPNADGDTGTKRSPALRQLLEGIGTPTPSPFTPDPFQLDALARLEHEDVLVTAPTGSGKTWIAREEIRRLLAAGKRAWYTSPLKALTNSKYVEFSAEFGAEKVGILTGDRKERSDAPLIVGTTEVFRNQIFDRMRRGANIDVDLVILDEAHYLADEERGHVWEETIILTPPRVRLLLLSATVGNATELARWIAEVRGARCSVVKRDTNGIAGGKRPVPLRAGFLYPDGELAPLVVEANNGETEFNPEINRFLQTVNSQRSSSSQSRFGNRGGNNSRRANMPELPPALMLESLGGYNLLPAIVFQATRRRCDEAATEAALGRRERNAERRDARQKFLQGFAEEHPEIRRHKHWEIVVKSGVASHHAGHLPAWKIAVEGLMSSGLLDAIFATTTVAAGVDFPARTVVLTVADLRTGNGWRPLGASEFQQMTGRAGRRGKDRVGFIILAPGRHQNPQRIYSLLSASPEPLESQFRATYTTLLNLLDAFGSFAHVREIVERSFAHRDIARRLARLEEQRAKNIERIKTKFTRAGFAPTDKAIKAVIGVERLASARARLQENLPETRVEAALRWLDDVVIPGRIVSVGRGGVKGRRLVFVTERRGGNVVGVRETGARAALTLERIGRVFAEVYPLAESEREAAFDDVHNGRNLPMNEPRRRETRQPTETAVELTNDFIDRLINDISDQTSSGTKSGTSREGSDDEGTLESRASATEGRATSANNLLVETVWSSLADAEAVHNAEDAMEALRLEAWQPFEQRARVLEHFGYLKPSAGEGAIVTERGRWLADLRVDRPLLVGEALASGLFARLDTASITGLMAALAADAERSYGELPLDDKLVNALSEFESLVSEVAGVEWEHELEPAPELNYSAAAAAARWAEGMKWETLVRLTGAEEGDLFRMLSRVGESLIQIGNLRETHAEAAARARGAASAVRREPVRSEELL